MLGNAGGSAPSDARPGMVPAVWSGRCSRAWCDDDGVVRVDFDGGARRVWIDDADRGRMAPALILCRRHAAALTPPLHWELHDLRRASGEPHPAGRRGADRLVGTASGSTGWRPRFDRADDLDGVLDARSPLLARAFASVHDRV